MRGREGRGEEEQARGGEDNKGGEERRRGEVDRGDQTSVPGEECSRGM